MFGTQKKRLGAGLAAVSLLALAACSSQGGAQNQTGPQRRKASD